MARPRRSLGEGGHPHARSLGGGASRRFLPAPRSGRGRFRFKTNPYHPPS